MADPKTTQAIEALAAEVGEAAYIDVANWHLYLSDARLHRPLAEQLYPVLERQTVSERDVQAALRQVTVRVGGGQRELSLAELIPPQSQTDLVEQLEDYQRRL